MERDEGNRIVQGGRQGSDGCAEYSIADGAAMAAGVNAGPQGLDGLLAGVLGMG